MEPDDITPRTDDGEQPADDVQEFLTPTDLGEPDDAPSATHGDPHSRPPLP